MDHQPEPSIEADAEEEIAFNPLPAATAALCLLSSEAANAAGPDWGKTIDVNDTIGSFLDGQLLTLSISPIRNLILYSMPICVVSFP